MKKLYLLMPDKVPYSLCAKSFAAGFKQSGMFVKKVYASEMDSEDIIKFKPNIIFTFGFSEISDGFFQKYAKINNDCVFVFYFLTQIDAFKEEKNINTLMDFNAKKMIFTADKSNLHILPEPKYFPSGIDYKKYKTGILGYKTPFTVMSNPNNDNVLKIIISIIQNYGRIDFYADEFDYINSLENKIWSDVKDDEIKNIYKKSYKGEVLKEQERAEIFNSSFINIVPCTKTKEGADFRILEIAASSGFALCETNEQLVKLFDAGHEIEIFSNEIELIDKTDFYLKNSSIADNICYNARKAAVNNHSVYSRVKTIIKYIEEKYNEGIQYE